MGITAVLLAGGQSKRMGRDKAFLKYKGKTFLRSILEEIEDYVDSIVLSINKPEDLYRDEVRDISKPVVFVKDKDRYAGPLNGIVSCKDYIKTEYFFLLTCDTPLFKGKLIPFLYSYIEDYQVVIPVIYGKLQPLNTIYKRETLDIGDKIYNLEKKNSLFSWIEKLKAKYIDENVIKAVDNTLESYFSVNRPEDYEKLLKR